MGACNTAACMPSSEGRNAFKVSHVIDRELLKLKKEQQTVIKLILLGSGNAGKSTIMKQFMMFHRKRGFTSKEKNEYKLVLWRSTIQSLKTLVRSAHDNWFDDDSKMGFSSVHGSYEGRLDEEADDEAWNDIYMLEDTMSVSRKCTYWGILCWWMFFCVCGVD